MCSVQCSAVLLSCSEIEYIGLPGKDSIPDDERVWYTGVVPITDEQLVIACGER